MTLEKLKMLDRKRFFKFLSNNKNGCLIYRGFVDRKGYGRFRYNGKTRSAHRVSWEFANGKIKNGLWVLHRCNNPSCVNVSHLYLGTRSDNQKDAVNNGTHNTQKISIKDRKKIVELSKNGMKLSKIAKEYGVNYNTIRKIFVMENFIWPDMRKFITNNDKRNILGMYYNGISLRKIGVKLGFSHVTVSRVLTKCV
jgi:lambda repressor-like predicted transcriptional regulator